MKKKLIIIPIVFLFFGIILGFNFSFWEKNDSWNNISCEYASRIKECLANQDNPRNITNFVCISWKPSYVAYQVILDWEFSKIDKEIEEFLTTLAKSQNNYFWPEKKKNFVEWIKDIHHFFDEKIKEYNNLCNGWISAKLASCREIPNVTISKSLKTTKNKNNCEKLVAQKIAIYEIAASIILKDNKYQILKDEHKKFTQKQRKKFDNLLDNIMKNRLYLDEIAQKWRSKTKHPN